MSFNDNAKVVFTYKEVFAEELPNIDETVKRIKEFKLVSIMLMCAQLQFFLQTKEGKNPQNQLRLFLEFLDDDSRARVNALLAKDQERVSGAYTFVHQVITLLAKLNLLHNTDGGIEIDTNRASFSFAKILVAVNDYWLDYDDDKIPPNTRINAEKYAIEYIRRRHARQSLQFMNQENILNLTARGMLLVEGIGRDTELKFGDRFERLTGLTIQEYYDILTLSIPYWLINGDILKKDDQVPRKLDVFFKNMDYSPEKIQNFYNLLSLDRKLYRKLDINNKDKFKTKKEEKFSDVIPFINKPLFSAGDFYLCMSPPFLAMQLTEGVYNIVRESLKKEDRRLQNLLPRLWGHEYERYILDRLEGAFGSTIIRNPRFKDAELVDAIVITDKFVLLIEIKYSHWRFVTRLTGSREDLCKDFTKFTIYKNHKNKKHRKVKGLGQIKKFIVNYKNGTFGSTYDFDQKELVPVLVLGDDFPMDPFSYSHYIGFAKSKKCVVNEKDVSLPLILTSDDVELLESMSEEMGIEKTIDNLGSYIKRVNASQTMKYLDRPTSFKDEVTFMHGSVRNSKFLKAQNAERLNYLKKYFKI